ncbi:MAG: hypothetical protein V3U75_11960, partial [Methylococcaceae bacterium]
MFNKKNLATYRPLHYFHILFLALIFTIFFQTSTVESATLPAHSEITKRLEVLNAQGQSVITVSRLDRNFKLMTNSILVRAKKYSVTAADSFELGNEERSLTFWGHTITMLNKFDMLVRDAQAVGDVDVSNSEPLREEGKAIVTSLSSLVAEPGVATPNTEPVTPVVSRGQISEAPTSPAPPKPLAFVAAADIVADPAPASAPDPVSVQPSSAAQLDSAFSLASAEAETIAEVEATPDVVSAEAEVEAEAVADISQAPANLQQSVKFYVSLAGNDSNPGTVSE